MMRSQSRFHTVLAGETPDRPLFTSLLTLYGAGLTKCPLIQYYKNAVAYVEGQHAVYDTFEPDILFAPYAFPILAEALGHDVRYFRDQPPNLCKPAFETPGEINRLELPDIDSHPRLLYLRDTVRFLSRDFRDITGVVSGIPSPLDFPILIFGLGNWLDTVLFDPDGASRVLEKTNPYWIAWANALYEDGADCLAMPLAMLSSDIVHPGTLDHVARKALEETLPEINGPVVLHHGGALLSHVFTKLHDVSPVIQGFAICEEDDTDRVFQLCGPDHFFLVGPFGPRLSQEGPERIYETSRRLIQSYSEHTRFVLFTAGADVPLDTPAECIHAMISAIKEEMHV